MKETVDGPRLPQRLTQERTRREGGASVPAGLITNTGASNTPLSLNIQSQDRDLCTHLPNPLPHATGGIKAQTLHHSGENMPWMANNAYPHGPVCVWDPNLYLYSEPNAEQLRAFDVVINVAMELPSLEHQTPPTCEYVKVDWSHTSHLIGDLPKLTKLIGDRLAHNKRVLVHCQCGVSRSASLVMAYMMAARGWSYSEAYESLKQRVAGISPNLNLVYELMEWGALLASGANPLLNARVD